MTDGIPGDDGIEVHAKSGRSHQEQQLLQLPLAKKHKGLRISASGILLRVGGQLKYGAQEMDRHLQRRWLAGCYKTGDKHEHTDQEVRYHHA